MTEEFSVEFGPDKIVPLLEQIRVGTLPAREKAARELLHEVHQAIYPMCLKMLDNPDDAYEAEAETMARLLARVGTDDYADAPIANGTAYVRSIARNVCHDLHRASRRRHDRSADELHEDEVAAVADHASTMNTPVTKPTAIHKDLIRAFGYTSKRALADLSCLSERELKAVILRQEGYSYIDIATVLGDGLSPETARTHGERGMHKLRGLAHVGVWQQEPLATWSTPRCPQLAGLKMTVHGRLAANVTITAELYQQIGRHLAPKPDRVHGGTTPLCRWCDDETDRSRREYWWLLILLMPFPLRQTRPEPRLVAFNTNAVAAQPPEMPPRAGPLRLADPTAGRPQKKRRDLVRTGALALLLLLLIIGAGGLVTRTLRDDEIAAKPATRNGQATTPESGTPALQKRSTPAATLGNPGQPVPDLSPTMNDPGPDGTAGVPPDAASPTQQEPVSPTSPAPIEPAPSFPVVPEPPAPVVPEPPAPVVPEPPAPVVPEPPAPGGACPSSPAVLCPASVLYSDQYLESPNGMHRLYMQNDGNLTILEFRRNGEFGNYWRAVWATNTVGQPGTRLQAQYDGNIVLVAPGEHPIWATNTEGHPGSVIKIQDDGTVVVYGIDGEALWPPVTPPQVIR